MPDDAPSSLELQPADLLVFTAVSQEFQIIKRRLQAIERVSKSPLLLFGKLEGRVSTALVQTGVGPARARAVADFALSRFFPRRALAFGFAGGLRPNVCAGALLQATGVFEMERMQVLPLAGMQIPSATTAVFVSTSHVVASPAEKAALYVQTRADAVDMESAALANACADRAIPLTVLRAVTDGADESLKPCFATWIGVEGSLNVAAVARTLLFQPAVWPAVFHLARTSRRAAAALAASLPAVADSCSLNPSGR